MQEYDTLNSALDQANSGDPNSACVAALAIVEYDRATTGLIKAQKIAERRSGARGANARKALLAAEARLKHAEESLSNPASFDNAVSKVQEMLSEVQTALDSMGAAAAESTARRILLGLGFPKETLDAPFESLSGGWRSRCSLASVLLQEPDLLILDEPTNYLDVPSILWLQSYLLSLENTTVVIVAHDRAFLDSVTSETIIMRKGKLTYYEGSISVTERAIMKKRKGMIRMKEGLDRKKAHIEKGIAEGARMARKTGDDKRARAVKSKQKKLDERFGLEVSEKGHRFKLNRDLGGYHLTNRAELTIEDLDSLINLPFPVPEALRFPGALCTVNNVSFRYPSSDRLILDSASLVIHPGARVGLVGKNGEGKSTLVKLIIGQLRPTKGNIERHSRVNIGYYSQHSVEELTSTAVGKTPALAYFIETLKERNQIQVDEQTAFAFLGGFCLQGKLAGSIPIAELSWRTEGMVRLALALVVYPAPQLLVLDEVSTHLDMDTTSALIKSLRSYNGAILIVSHDRHLIQSVIEGAPLIPDIGGDGSDSNRESDEDEEDDYNTGVVYRVGPKGRVEALPGGVDDYISIVERRLSKEAVG
ncbi:hypothetical protein QCA50_015508 [Cerrena zonata]|uniref:ABC transporter domain-containing protein n=1 Tax=Cerrena zonata TaxID=2478898 RepID=A0AAW0FL10_9APHY